jgi:formate dehydrogenase subunit gamma
MSATGTSGEHRYFERFTPSQRIEHAVQIVSFSTLVFTGLVQKFNTSPAAEWIIHRLGGIEWVRVIHRSFGVVLIAEAIYHVGVTGFALLIRRRKTRMFPSLQDLRDLVQMLLYFVGLREERARFDRFDFRQKAEYWSLVWGSAVMIATGLMMWFPVRTTVWLSGEAIPAARAAHGNEGLLAFLAILVWHMYSAHLSPEVFPIDTCIFTGKISEERMKHEHPMEYERLVAKEEPTPAASLEAGGDGQRFDHAAPPGAQDTAMHEDRNEPEDPQ